MSRDSAEIGASQGLEVGSLEDLSDGDLLQAARDGRHGPLGARAASLLLERYQDRVYIWCFRMVREHERALDLAQDTLVSAYRRLDSFEGRSAFASWLFVIARNRCLSALRRPSLFAEYEGRDVDPPDPGPTPDELLERRLDEETVLDLIKRHLDPVERDALWLRCFEGVPVDEITRLLRIDAATGARSVLQRARRKLKAALKDSSRSSSRGGGMGTP